MQENTTDKSDLQGQPDPRNTPEGRLTEALTNVRTAIRYHLRREAYFDSRHRMVGVITLIFSSAAVVAILQNSEWSKYIAAIVAVAQALDLVVDNRGKSALHRDLRQRYLMLEPDLLKHSGLTEAQYAAFRRRFASFEVEEPPCKKVLLEVCQDEAMEVAGHRREDNPDSFSDHPAWKRRLANFWFIE